MHEITDLLVLNSINILAISETHLDDTFEDEAVGIQGYNLYGRTETDMGERCCFLCSKPSSSES